MPAYVEYQLDENSTILIEAPEGETGGVIKASRELGEIAKTKAQKSFSDALKDIRVQAKILLNEIEELHVEEAEVKFGINTVGELGNMAIGKVGVGVNYEVTLKWKKLITKSKK
ncbi:MAG TPA: CU044_2847 family protein [Anaerolineales bacterium]|jgi:hypothetical protein|nr:CU044_2847 family protein [Anaerolineales bacterium]HQX14973.1 CU044_2847 family protein [Anaerolineales bacterium]